MIKGLVEINSPISCNVSLETGKRKYTYRDTQVEIIQKDLEVLDIIKNKEVDIPFIFSCKDYNEYGMRLPLRGCKFSLESSPINLSEYEFKLLKEWLR